MHSHRTRPCSWSAAITRDRAGSSEGALPGQERIDNGAAQRLLAAAGLLAPPGDVAPVGADAVAARRQGGVAMPADADIADPIQLPSAEHAATARTAVGDRAAGQEVEIVARARSGLAGQGVVLH